MPARALSARELAALVEGELVGPDDVVIAGVAALDEAGPGDLSFLASTAYLPYFQASSAGVVLVAPEFRDAAAGPATRIVVSEPRRALQRVLSALAPADTGGWGIHPTAVLGRRTRWRGRIAVGAGSVIGAEVRLGEGCRIGAHTRIGDGAVLGDGCRLEEHVLIGAETVLGNRVLVRAGARIGAAGFAYVTTGGQHARVTHVGRCRLEDDVDVGANTTIARGSIGTTLIGAGTKIDNLVQVGHNVRIGARCIIMAQVGIAGTTTIGADVVLAGQAGLAGQLAVGDGARVAAQSGVIGDVAAGATVSGYPARDHRRVLRQQAALARLTPIVASLERLASPHDHAD